MSNYDIVEDLINQFCTVKDRSVRLKITTENKSWEYGFLDHVKRPAASLVKILIATSVEEQAKKNVVNLFEDILVNDLIDTDYEPSILRSLDLNHLLSIAELIQVLISASDPFASKFLMGLIDVAQINEMQELANLSNSEFVFNSTSKPINLIGQITAKDALKLVEFGSNSKRYPLTAKGLSNSILNSRIPLGIANTGTRISHKTGTLLSVAHDVALIECHNASIGIAFLTENQDDTLQTGYEMGICTRRIIETLNYSVQFTRSFD